MRRLHIFLALLLCAASGLTFGNAVLAVTRGTPEDGAARVMNSEGAIASVRTANIKQAGSPAGSIAPEVLFDHTRGEATLTVTVKESSTRPEGGPAISDAKVMICADNAGKPGDPVGDPVQSNKDGIATFSLQDGSYFITVEKNGTPDVDRFAEVEPIKVTMAGTALAQEVKIDRFLMVKVKVVDAATEKSIPSASVYPAGKLDLKKIMTGETESFELQTNMYAAFTAVADGYDEATCDNFFVNSELNQPVVVKLTAKATTGGKADKVVIKVTDATDKAAIIGATVKFNDKEVKTVEGGLAEFADVAYKTYTATVTHKEYTEVTKNDIVVDATTAANGTLEVPIEMTKTATGNELTVTVKKYAADAQGQLPIDMALVTVNNDPATRAHVQKYTDNTGVAKFNLADGKYTIKIEKDGYGTFENKVTMNGAAQTLPGGPVLLGVVVAQFEVTVKLEGGDKVADNTSVELIQQNQTTAFQTKQTTSGVATFTSVPEGKYNVKVAAIQGYQELNKEIEVKDDPNNKIEVVIPKAVTSVDKADKVEITFNIPAGTPATEAVAVTLHKDNAQTATYTVTADNGKATFTDVEVGTYHIKATFAGYKPVDEELAVTKTDLLKKEIVLEASTPQPPAGQPNIVLVSVYEMGTTNYAKPQEGGSAVIQIKGDPNSRQDIARGSAVYGLPEGGVTFQVKVFGYVDKDVVYTVTADEQQNVAIYLEPVEVEPIPAPMPEAPVAVTISVVDAETNAPIPGAFVAVTDTQTFLLKGESDKETGKVAFQQVPVGPALIVVNLLGYDLVRNVENIAAAPAENNITVKLTAYAAVDKLLVKLVYDDNGEEKAVIEPNAVVAFVNVKNPKDVRKSPIPTGEATFEKFRIAKYNCIVTAPGYKNYKAEVDVAAVTEEVVVKLTKLPDATIPVVITVVDALTGEPLKGAKVSHGDGQYAFTNEAGQVNLKSCKASGANNEEKSVEFVVMHEAYPPVTEKFDVREKNNEFTVELKGYKTTISLEDETGKAITKGAVTLAGIAKAAAEEKTGTYDFVLPAGMYDLTVNVSGYEPIHKPIYIGKEYSEKIKLVPVKNLIVIVTDDKGLVVKGATVLFDNAKETTDAKGTASVSLPAGFYKAKVKHPAFEDYEDGTEFEVKAAGLNTHEVALTPRAKVTVTVEVKAKDSGEPIAGAVILFGAANGKTDNTGKATVDVIPGKYDVLVEHPNALPFKKEGVKVKTDQTTHNVVLEVQVAPVNDGVVFIVVNHKKQPVAEAKIVIAGQTLTTDATGKATASLHHGLREGVVTCNLYAEKKFEVQIDESYSAEKPIVVQILPADVVMTITLLDEEGNVLQDEFVAFCKFEKGKLVAITEESVGKTDAFGKFSCELPYGSCIVFVRPANGVEEQFAQAVTPETNQVTVKIRQKHNHSFLVVDVEGNPLPHVPVAIYVKTADVVVNGRVTPGEVEKIAIGVTGPTKKPQAGPGEIFFTAPAGTHEYAAVLDGYEDAKGSFTVGGAEGQTKIVMKTRTPVASELLSVVTLYPNPTEGLVYLENVANVQQVSVLTLSGAKVKSQLLRDGQNRVAIDIRDLASGLYLVVVEVDGARRAIRVVKN